MTQQEHDSQMAIVQNLMHSQSIILGSTLKKLNKEIKTSSPIFRAHMNIIERMAKQNGSLYSDMQTENQEYLENVYPIWKSESENQFERTEKKDKQ
jgi:prephenate dehydrogenase